GGQGERRAAAGKAGAAKRGAPRPLGQTACAAPQTRRPGHALTLRKVCRAGFAEASPAAACRPPCPPGGILAVGSPTRDAVSGRLSGGDRLSRLPMPSGDRRWTFA